MKITPTGFDLGNARVKICIDNKCASIPSLYAFDKPIVLGKSGQEVKSKAYNLIFRQDGNNFSYWFGQDILASQSTIHKLKSAKYDAKHISILFRAALYQWSKQHKISISDLGKLNIVASMPPGLYQQRNLYNQALKAYRKAFNRGQSHVKIKDSKHTVQIVTQFSKLIREAIVWGQAIPHQGEIVLVLDLGGETNDIAIFNGSSEPVYTKTLHIGLLHTYAKINPANPQQAELKILQSKGKLPTELISHYNQAENVIQLINGQLPRQIDRIYLIGGGASLMPKSIKPTFTSLAKNVIIKNEFANCIANWKEASKYE